MPRRPPRHAAPRPRRVRARRRVVIKLHDGSLRQGAPPGSFQQRLATLRQQHPGVEDAAPLFDPATWPAIHDRQKDALGGDPSYAPVDFPTFWRVRFDSSLPAPWLAAQFAGWPEVEYAYLEPEGSNPADPWFGDLAHFLAAPDGVGLAVCDGVGAAGAHGHGVRIADVERGWYVGHVEFHGGLPVDAAGTPLTACGVPQTSETDQDHGCGVLGVLWAQLDGVGIQGAAPLTSELLLCSYVESDGSENLPAAMMTATLALGAGDVLLLEVQITDAEEFPAFENMPVEIAPAAFAVARLASALGIAVIEAAGNGTADLDFPIPGGGPWMTLDRAAADFEDSGALMVSASKRLSAGSLKPLSYANVGGRVDLYAVGELVFTTAHPMSGPDYAFMNGTSPAAAVIAGVAAAVQGAAKELRGAAYTPYQLRWLLGHQDYSTASADPAADRIGRMPDLGKIFAGGELPKTPDLYLRDHVGDDGTPHSGALSSSPDVILRRAKSADPQAEFGPASGAMDDLGLHQDAVAGAAHWLYARVFDRAGADAADARVTLWWSPPSMLIHPGDWQPIGEAVVAAVPASGASVSEGLEWPAAEVPGAGHHCFLALLDHPSDPAPALPDFGAISAAGYDAWSAFKSFVRNVNNATWRNFDVLEPVVGAETAEEFFARGAPDGARRMRLRFRLEGSAGSVRVRIPADLWSIAEEARTLGPAARTRDGVELSVAAGAEVLLTAEFPARARYALRLQTTWKRSEAEGAVFHAIQSDLSNEFAGEQELGRVSRAWSAGRS